MLKHSDSLQADVDENLIRGVPLHVCLSSWGRHFRTSRDRDNYELSRTTQRIDHFLSHDWETQRRDKFLALVWAFNARAAVIATALVSIGVGVMRVYGVFGSWDHWWTVVFGHITFIVVLLFWHSMRAWILRSPLVFLDVLCISQKNEQLKRAGILGLAAFLNRSKRLDILWSPQWSSRLWCVFELAAFLRDSDRKAAEDIRIMPVKMASVLLLMCGVSVITSVTHSLVMDFGSSSDLELHDGTSETGVADEARSQLTKIYLALVGVMAVTLLAILPSFMYIGLHIIKDLADLPVHLRKFSVHQVKCYCCTNEHRDPNTGDILPCDRALVFSMLRKWYDVDENDESYLESFNRMVRFELSRVVVNTGGSALPFDQAVWTAISFQLPWLTDYIPWWASSDLQGWQYFLWFLRGLLLWSYNVMLWLWMMRVCIILWTRSVPFMGRIPKVVLVLTQAILLITSGVCFFLPFRWWYVLTGETSLMVLIPYVVGVCFIAAVFRPGLAKLQRQQRPRASPSPSTASKDTADTKSDDEHHSVVSQPPEDSEDELQEESF